MTNETQHIMAPDRHLMPAIATDFRFDFLTEETTVLSNGTTLCFIPGGVQDVLKIELVYNAGNLQEPQNLVASVTNDLLGEGTKRRSSAEINELLDFYGAYVQKETSRDHAMISLFTLNRNLASILPVFIETLVESAYPEEEFLIEMNNRKARFENNLKKVEYVCRNHFSALLFGNHPYGRILTHEDYEQLHQHHLVRFYESFYKKGSLHIFVSGMISDPLKAMLSEAFSSLPQQPSVHGKSVPPAYIPQRKKIHVDNAIQSAIRIGKPMIMLEHEDYQKVSVANTLLGGYFGSRLMKNIREEKGYTYGIGSGISSFSQSGMFYIATEVGRDVTQATLDEVYKEITQMQEKEVVQEELDTARNYMLGNFLKSIDGPFAQAEKIKTRVLRNLPSNFYQQHLEKIAAVTVTDVQEASKKYFSIDSLSELVAGTVS